MTDSRPPSPSNYRAMGLVGNLGVTVAAGPIVGVLIGYWIDGRWNTAPWGLTSGVILGLLGGMRNGWRLLQEANRGNPDARNRDSGKS